MTVALTSLTLSSLVTFGLNLGLVVVAVGCTTALWMLISARHLSVQTGLSSDAVIVASDTGQVKVAKLWDAETGLYGQPDYVLQEQVGGRSMLVPVETKPTRKSARPYESDELQLGVYLILLRANYPDQFAGFGRLTYQSQSFVIELTPALEARVLAQRDGVRADRRSTQVHRNHKVKSKCASCSMRAKCGESLATPAAPRPAAPPSA